MTRVRGRLVLDDRVTSGEVVVDGATIIAIELDEGESDGPLVAPGFIDVHVHGWGGHSAMGGRAALDGMARALLRRGVTTFLPTAWTTPLDALARFADEVRDWLPGSPIDGAGPLGFNLEGPFLSEARRGAHAREHLRVPADVQPGVIEGLVDGLRLITIAPEVPGALELIRSLVGRGVRVSLGHSAASLEESQAGYAAGATSTTHLFNAMSGVDHRRPGLAVAALGDDHVYVELIADLQHVDPSLLPIITRTKPADRLMLVSDALLVAGTAASRVQAGDLELDVQADRVTIAGTTTLAGSVIALDAAVRNLVAEGVPIHAVFAAASANPAAMLGVADRGRIAVGLRADLVELDDELRVRRVMRGGEWFEVSAGT